MQFFLAFVVSIYKQDNLLSYIGAVWCLDPSWDSKYLLTGAADNSAKLWDIETGTQILSYETGSAVRSCGFSYSGKQLFYSTDKGNKRIFEYNVSGMCCHAK